MGVMIEFFATLRDAVGTDSLEVDCVGTVGEIIGVITEKFGQDFRDAIMEGSKMKEMVKIMVNGRDVRELRGLETEVKDGDCVSMFPPVAGG